MRPLQALLTAAIALVAIAGPVQAQRFGPQLSWGNDADIGIGARGEFDLAGTLSEEGPLSEAFAIATVDYFLWDCPLDCTWIDVGANLAVPLPVEGVNSYAGAGIDIARVSVDTPAIPPFISASSVSNTEIGVNVFSGLKFALGGMAGFAEAKFQLSGGEQFVLSAGILFGG